MFGKKRAGKNRKLPPPAASKGESRRRAGTQDESGLSMTNIAAQQAALDAGSHSNPDSGASGCESSSGGASDSGSSSFDSGGSSSGGGDSGGCGGGGGD